MSVKYVYLFDIYFVKHVTKLYHSIVRGSKKQEKGLLKPLSANRNKSCLLFSSAEMFKKPL